MKRPRITAAMRRDRAHVAADVHAARAASSGVVASDRHPAPTPAPTSPRSAA